MWLTIIGDVVMVGVKWALARFTPSVDRQLGRAEVQSQQQSEALKDVQKAQVAAGSVTSSDSLLNDPANRDNHS
jgi:hypothetical protein